MRRPLVPRVTRRSAWTRCAAAIMLSLVVSGSDAVAETKAPASFALSSIPDTILLDQHAAAAHLVSERVGDRIAIVTFTFTSCTTICPILDGIFQRVQAELGSALDHEVVLLTVSVDPETDIPERLRAHTQRLGAGPGWSYLTGERDDVTALLRALEAYVPDIQSHAPNVLVVDGARGRFTRLYGMPSPKAIVAAVESVRASRRATTDTN